MVQSVTPFPDEAIRQAFNAFPEAERLRLMEMRELIYRTAAETDGVGALEECLKWGQPAYLTPATHSGSTIRLGVPKTGGVALYVHCQTSILSDFRAQFPDTFTLEGNRGVHFGTDETPAELPLAALIRSALTYHLNKR